MVVWEVASGKALCGNPTGSEYAHRIKFFNQDNTQLVSVHNLGVKVWKADLVNKKLRPTEVALGQIKRNIISVAIDPTDTYAYCGTKTGDILEVYLERCNFKRCGPVKRLFAQGINCIDLLPNGDILVGSGDGTVAKVGLKDMKVKAESKLMGACTSLALTSDGSHFFAGTNKATIYWSDSD